MAVYAGVYFPGAHTSFVCSRFHEVILNVFRPDATLSTFVIRKVGKTGFLS